MSEANIALRRFQEKLEIKRDQLIESASHEQNDEVRRDTITRSMALTDVIECLSDREVVHEPKPVKPLESGK